MTTNVTQKDKTLKAVIDYCTQLNDLHAHTHGEYWNGYKDALFAVQDYCMRNSGYAGQRMPLEVPNQSEKQ